MKLSLQENQTRGKKITQLKIFHDPTNGSSSIAAPSSRGAGRPSLNPNPILIPRFKICSTLDISQERHQLCLLDGVSLVKIKITQVLHQGSPPPQQPGQRLESGNDFEGNSSGSGSDSSDDEDGEPLPIKLSVTRMEDESSDEDIRHPQRHVSGTRFY